MLLRALVLASLAAMLVAPPVTAVTAIPDEGAIALPDGAGRITGAMVGDVDGDAVRELVRLLAWSTNRGQQAVEVTTAERGGPSTRGEALLRRSATSEPADLQRRPADGLLPVGINEPARLVAWHEDGQERVLVATIGTTGLTRPCCLTLWRVGLRGSDTAVERVELISPEAASLPAASIRAADLDGDGTDELVAALAPNPALEPHFFNQVVVILRWTGSGFDVVPTPALQVIPSGPLLDLGDSDGLPGAEVGFLQDSFDFDQTTPALVRIGMDVDGHVRVETARLPDIGELAAVDGPDGGRLVLVNDAGTSLLDWPAGTSALDVVASTWRGGSLLGVLENDADPAILVIRGGAVDVLDAILGSRQGISPSNTAARLVTTGREPYAGPLVGGDPDRGDDAFVFSGRLITEQPAHGARVPGFLFTLPVAELVGMAPIGLLGAGSAWAAVSRPALPIADRRGGPLERAKADAATSMWLVPSAAMLTPAAEDGEISPTIIGGVADATRELPTLLTAGQLSAAVRAPEGSELRARMESAQVARVNVLVADETRSAEIVLADGVGDGSQFSVDLEVTTPAGHGYREAWAVRVLQHAPRLEISASGSLLSFGVVVAGTTERGAAIEVDGTPVAVAPDGTFRATVEAGPFPRDVRVVATNQLGRRSEDSVSVVAPIDYRRLPWVPIALGFTLLAAAVLFLRAPRPVRHEPDGHGTLEELE